MEMMIVLFVITILLLITIPNIAKHYSNIKDKGCEGMVKMVQSQVTAYWLDQNKMPTSIQDLKMEGYLDMDHEYVCPGGEPIVIENGVVTTEAGS